MNSTVKDYNALTEEVSTNRQKALQLALEKSPDVSTGHLRIPIQDGNIFVRKDLIKEGKKNLHSIYEKYKSHMTPEQKKSNLELIKNYLKSQI